MSKYEVLYYTSEKGKCEVAEFIFNTNEKCQAKIYNQIDHLKEYGLTRYNPNIRKLTNTPFWEIRILGRDNLRLFCSTVETKIIVFHIFFKKKQKTPERDIKIALKRYKDLVDI